MKKQTHTQKPQKNKDRKKKKANPHEYTQHSNSGSLWAVGLWVMLLTAILYTL